MTVTLNSDCSLFTFTADYLTALIASDPEVDTGMVSVNLKYKLNCASGSPVTVNLTDEIENIETNSLSISPSILFSNTSLDKFCDGIYYFELTSVYNVIEELEIRQYTTTESICFFVDCDLKCKIVEKMAEDVSNHTLLVLYDAIKYGISCDSCGCATACEFYTELKCALNEPILTTNTLQNGCGCN